MSLATIITGVASVLATVTTANGYSASIGTIHSFRRRMADRAAVLARAVPVADGPVNVWLVYRDRTQRNAYDGNAQLYAEHHAILVEGFYSLTGDGASETTFDGIVEDINVAFHRDQSLGANDNMVASPTHVRVDDHSREIGGVLCHHVIIEVPVVEYRSDVQGGP